MDRRSSERLSTDLSLREVRYILFKKSKKRIPAYPNISDTVDLSGLYNDYNE